ncbi:hypothetical protein [Bacillus sp. AFS023182]|uniref:hypothetical protein n=1 Tax=Bacillus sp. AFS023182 TaxID=2033492 RepID=UPI0020D20FE2|nr:hypothetical protein [Bacillus sp. AFS023182]
MEGAGKIPSGGKNLLKDAYQYVKDTGESLLGSGAKITSNSIETLTRDQARQVAENLLERGEISLSDLKSMIPSGIPDSFVSTGTIVDGAKY